MLLRDLILHGKSPWEDVYSPSRHTILASARNFVVENINVADNLLEGKLTPPPNNVEIKPGEGKVVEADGQRSGAYRDEQGNLHIVNTTCTHMGCELNWNSAEKSWDCPCHGSRFSYDGEVIEGPALNPLRANIDVNTLERVLTDRY
jgi:Rieske Fe-S protein